MPYHELPIISSASTANVVLVEIHTTGGMQGSSTFGGVGGRYKRVIDLNASIVFCICNGLGSV